jgi:hypothetical protein
MDALLQKYVKPFTESEVPDMGCSIKNSRAIIDKHQVCIEILEGIQYFEQSKKHKIESIEGFAGTFPELRRKYVHEIDIYNRCIKRLEQRHDKVILSILAQTR